MDKVVLRQIVAELQHEVRNFHQHRSGKNWNWSCDICGDSRTNRRKARFGVAIKDGSVVCHCFNCDYSAPFTLYLKDYHPNLYQRYVTDSFINNAPTLYDLNHLVEGIEDTTILAYLFYIDRYSDPKQWLQCLEHKKISLKEKNIRALYNIHRQYHGVNNGTQSQTT